MRKTTVVKFPVDILKQLEKKYPKKQGYTNAERVRILYKDHLELQELRNRMTKMGKFIYGKNRWEDRYGKV